MVILFPLSLLVFVTFHLLCFYKELKRTIEDLDYDIVLKVKPEKVSQIKSEVIDGKKYLVIPIDEDEQANVNGIDNLI